MDIVQTHVAQSVIEAGIDVTSINVSSVQYDEENDSYTLELPAPVITSCRNEYLRQYERKGSGAGCNVDWDEARLIAERISMVAFVKDMQAGGLLDRAQVQTELIMGNLINAVTGSKVAIVFEEPVEDEPLPPSCDPPIPLGWIHNEETNEWIKDS